MLYDPGDGFQDGFSAWSNDKAIRIDQKCKGSCAASSGSRSNNAAKSSRWPIRWSSALFARPPPAHSVALDWACASSLDPRHWFLFEFPLGAFAVGGFQTFPDQLAAHSEDRIIGARCGRLAQWQSTSFTRRSGLADSIFFSGTDEDKRP